MNITSGTNIPNQGSLGAAQDGTLTLGAGLLAQASPLGAGEAIQWDGADTKVAVTAPAAITTAAARTWCFLHKPLSAGENNSAAFWNYSNLGSGEAHIGVTSNITSHMNATTTDAVSITNAGVITIGSWQMTFINCEYGGDIKIHIYTGIAGAVTEATYSSQTAGGAPPTSFSSQLNLGNRALNDLTWNGLFSRVLFFGNILTVPQMLQLTTLAGLT
jgi:hypothetical protein